MTPLPLPGKGRSPDSAIGHGPSKELDFPKTRSERGRNTHPLASSAHFNTSAPKSLAKPKAWRKMPVGLLIGLCAFAIVILVVRQYQISSLQNEAFSTGYILVGLCVGLLTLNVRKRLVGASIAPTLLGNVRHWQRVHHWLGCICLFCYLVHAGLWTQGWLDSLLGLLFWVIVLSGFVSWYINYTSPKLLQAAGPALLKTDILELKRSIKEDAYRLALRCAGSGNSSAIAEIYRAKLANYFELERGLLYRIHPNGKKRRMLVHEIDLLDRFLDDQGRELKQEMINLVKRRDDLDFQSAIQARIRFWAAFHQCLLGAFVVLCIMHIVLAHLYSSHW